MCKWNKLQCFFKWLDIATIKLILNKNPILGFTGDSRFSGASMSWIPREMCWYSSQLCWPTWSVPIIPPVHFSTAVFGDLSVRKYNNCPLNTVSHTILTNISKFQEGHCWTGIDVKGKACGTNMLVPENETDHSKKLWKKSQERKHSWHFLLLLFVVITYF